jgi:hypothetical protein
MNNNLAESNNQEPGCGVSAGPSWVTLGRSIVGTQQQRTLTSTPTKIHLSPPKTLQPIGAGAPALGQGSAKQVNSGIAFGEQRITLRRNNTSKHPRSAVSPCPVALAELFRTTHTRHRMRTKPYTSRARLKAGMHYRAPNAVVH